MTDQDKIALIKKYRDNPSAIIEDFFPEIKLYTYQKILLKALMTKDKVICLMRKGVR